MSNVESVRDVAVDHHHQMSPVFEQHYRDMAASRFTSAFTYGRHKVDVVLDRELAKLPPGADALDVGCGTGVYVKRFQAQGMRAVGVEPAEGMIEAARRFDPSLDIRKGIATELPFPDASFDFVSAIEVLRYLHREDIRASLREMMRVLKPGGTLFVTMVNRYALDGFYVFNWIRQQRKRSSFDVENPHCEFFTPSEMNRELRNAGGVDVHAVGRLFAPMRIAYRLSAPMAQQFARRFEPMDDALSGLAAMMPFAGHLIGIAHKP